MSPALQNPCYNSEPRESTLPTGDSDAFQDLLDSFRHELQPAGGIEDHLVFELASAWWRLQRCWAWETALIDGEMQRQVPLIAEKYQFVDQFTRQALALRALSDESQSLELLGRHESRLCRAFSRALRDLEKHRESRKNEPTTVRQPASTFSRTLLNLQQKSESRQIEPSALRLPPPAVRPPASALRDPQQHRESSKNEPKHPLPTLHPLPPTSAVVPLNDVAPPQNPRCGNYAPPLRPVPEISFFSRLQPSAFCLPLVKSNPAPSASRLPPTAHRLPPSGTRSYIANLVKTNPSSLCLPSTPPSTPYLLPPQLFP